MLKRIKAGELFNDEAIIDDHHQEIRNALTIDHSAEFAIAAGNAYFRAWSASSGVARLRLEHDCIQDYVRCAMVIKNENLLVSIRLILDAFHKNKPKAGIDEMLYRIYEPVLWRSLNASNPQVRLHAAVIFFASFPLHDPSTDLNTLD